LQQTAHRAVQGEAGSVDGPPNEIHMQHRNSRALETGRGDGNPANYARGNNMKFVVTVQRSALKQAKITVYANDITSAEETAMTIARKVPESEWDVVEVGPEEFVDITPL
jgi:hypothetical protein